MPADPPITLMLGWGATGQSVWRLAQARGEATCVLVEHPIDLHQNAPHRGITDCLVWEQGTPRPKVGDGTVLWRRWDEGADVDAWLADWNVKQVVMSPGFPPDHPLVRALEASGCPCMSDLSYWRQVCQAPALGVSGTNGKSTVATLVARMLEAAGIPVVLAGNIGQPVGDQWCDHPDPNGCWWVLELSSAQLHYSAPLHLEAAALLPITPDHVSWHGSLEAYRAAKARIFLGCQQPIATADAMERFPLDAQDCGWVGGYATMNGAVAMALADVAGCDVSVAREVVATFPGLPHRCERVGTHHGVVWINDSKATNVAAALGSCAGVRCGYPDHGLVWLLGGIDKGDEDLEGLARSWPDGVTHVLTFGAQAQRFVDALPPGANVEVLPTLEAAVEQAEAITQARSQPWVVLLSPAGASFDAFPSFEARGEAFRSAVKALNPTSEVSGC